MEDTPALVPVVSDGDYDALVADATRVLDEVDAALGRLADHSYGTCEVCGGPIGEGRSAADPVARTCERHLDLSR